MKQKRVLDSYALLAYLMEEGGSARVKELLASDAEPVLMNAVNVGEVFYILARERGDRAAAHFLNVILPSLPITIIESPLKGVIAAARLKAEYPLAFADCFAAATALEAGAILVTGDSEFRKLEPALQIEWL